MRMTSAWTIVIKRGAARERPLFAIGRRSLIPDIGDTPLDLPAGTSGGATIVAGLLLQQTLSSDLRPFGIVLDMFKEHLTRTVRCGAGPKRPRTRSDVLRQEVPVWVSSGRWGLMPIL
jgi:hypothetical protein